MGSILNVGQIKTILAAARKIGAERGLGSPFLWVHADGSMVVIRPSLHSEAAGVRVAFGNPNASTPIAAVPLRVARAAIKDRKGTDYINVDAVRIDGVGYSGAHLDDIPTTTESTADDFTTTILPPFIFRAMGKSIISHLPKARARRGIGANGVRLDPTAVVATSGPCLIAIRHDGPAIGFTVPADAWRAMHGIASARGAGEVVARKDGATVSLRCGDWTVSADSVANGFPQWESVMPKDPNARATVRVDDAANAVRRAARGATEELPYINLDVNRTWCRVHAAADPDAVTSIPREDPCNGIAIRGPFEPELIDAALAAVKASGHGTVELLRVESADASANPLELRGKGDDTVRVVLMPMMTH